MIAEQRVEAQRSWLHAAVVLAAASSVAFKPVGNSSVIILIAAMAASWLGLRAVPGPKFSGIIEQTSVLAAGVMAFGAVRVFGHGFSVSATAVGVGILILAAASEEILFRGYLYAWLNSLGWGALATGAVSAVSFALIHVPTYGWWVVPIDIAAGAILSWQREVTGSWVVPAVTHAAANLMQLRF